MPISPEGLKFWWEVSDPSVAVLRFLSTSRFWLTTGTATKANGIALLIQGLMMAFGDMDVQEHCDPLYISNIIFSVMEHMLRYTYTNCSKEHID